MENTWVYLGYDNQLTNEMYDKALSDERIACPDESNFYAHKDIAEQLQKEYGFTSELVPYSEIYKESYYYDDYCRATEENREIEKLYEALKKEVDEEYGFIVWRMARIIDLMNIEKFREFMENRTTNSINMIEKSVKSIIVQSMYEKSLKLAEEWNVEIETDIPGTEAAL